MNNSSGVLANSSSPVSKDTNAYSSPALIYGTTYFGVTVLVLAIILNFELLFVFLRHRSRLITSSTIHIVNLTVINLLTASLYDSINMIHNLYRDFFVGQSALCAAYKYLQWTGQGMIIQQHMVICLDRWLAVLCPIWYRNKPAIFGLQCTLIVFLYHQACYLPLFVSDILTPVRPDRYCDVTVALPGYAQIARILTAFAPQCIVYFSYPWLLYIVCRRRKGERMKVTVNNKTEPRPEPQPSLHPPSTQHTALPSPDPSAKFSSPAVQPIPRKRSNKELNLALALVLVQIICWLPMNTTSVLLTMRGTLSGLYDSFVISLELGRVIRIIDPLVNLIFLKNLRVQVIAHLRGLICHG